MSHTTYTLSSRIDLLHCPGGIQPFSVSTNHRPVRLAYQPPASSTFISEQTSHHQPANNIFLSEQTSTSHQQPAERTGPMFL
jgi:hypothetical protein